MRRVKINMLAEIKEFANRMLDVVLPRRGRSVRTQKLAPENIPVFPAVADLLQNRITTLMDYKEPAVEDLIRSLKYDGSSHAANLCAHALADFLREELSSTRQFSSRKILLVPVPLHKSRARERGFNQIELVLKRLPEEFRNGELCALALRALARVRATEQQTRLSRGERIKNVAGAFAVLDGNLVRDAHIFLIDDVTTTGATLVNAAAPLMEADAEVTLIALARA